MAAPRKAKASKKLVCTAALAAAAAIAAFAFFSRKSSPRPPPATSSTPPRALEPADASVFGAYAGSESCKSCHQTEYQPWHGSHHGLAERPIDKNLDLAA